MTEEHLREAECVLLGKTDGLRITTLVSFEERSVTKLHNTLADDISSRVCHRLLCHSGGSTLSGIREIKMQLIGATARILRQVAFQVRCRDRIGIDALCVEEACSSLHIRCYGDSQIPRARGRSGYLCSLIMISRISLQLIVISRLSLQFDSDFQIISAV